MAQRSDGEERRGGWAGDGMLPVRAMTEEQIEVLRRQIVDYAVICERLVQMHKTLAAQHQHQHHPSSSSELNSGSMNCDPLTMTKITSRQRWIPTAAQLRFLESLFDQGIGARAPSKTMIKEITLELLQHGQISESNVYNWFQNRRARSKRKQTGHLPNSSESEMETDVESSNEKKSKLAKMQHYEKLPCHFWYPAEASPDLHCLDQEIKQTPGIYVSNDASRSSGNSSQMSLYETGTSHLLGKMENSESYVSFHPGQSYRMN